MNIYKKANNEVRDMKTNLSIECVNFRSLILAVSISLTSLTPESPSDHRVRYNFSHETFNFREIVYALFNKKTLRTTLFQVLQLINELKTIKSRRKQKINSHAWRCFRHGVDAQWRTLPAKEGTKMTRCVPFYARIWQHAQKIGRELYKFLVYIILFPHTVYFTNSRRYLIPTPKSN